MNWIKIMDRTNSYDPYAGPYGHDYISTEDVVEKFVKEAYRRKPSNKGSEKKETKATMKTKLPKIKNIDFQPPLTVVIWDDGTKTFVKCLDTDEFDPEKGAAMAIAKKALGDKYHYNDVINYYIEKYYKKHPKFNKQSVELSVDEQNIICLIRKCGEESKDFVHDLLLDAYKNM